MVMTNNLLDFEYNESGNLQLDKQPFAVRTLFQECVESLIPLAEQKRISLAAAEVPDDMQLTADRARIIQIMINLIGNSLKYCPDGSRVTCGAEQKQGTTEIWVSDDGPGIDSTKLATVFERFSRLHSTSTPEEVLQPLQAMSASDSQTDGFGLGLATCKLLIEKHGGSIWAESTPGQGARFVFAIPDASK